MALSALAPPALALLRQHAAAATLVAAAQRWGGGAAAASRCECGGAPPGGAPSRQPAWHQVAPRRTASSWTSPPGGSGGGASSSSSTASGRGELPRDGPRRDALVALPFAVSRSQADAAFAAFHSKHWLQNPSLPRWARTSKESYLPFWVGEARVAVEVLSAEVGRDELVRVLDRRTGR
jgi:hypothetical protein